MNLPPSLEEFIGRYVDSIETLEILLLLKRSPETYWMTTAIESHLGIRSGTAEKHLRELLDNRFIVRGMTGAFRYSPSNEGHDEAVTALAAAYADQRVAVVNAVFSESLSRLRAFANAFKVTSE